MKMFEDVFKEDSAVYDTVMKSFIDLHSNADLRYNPLVMVAGPNITYTADHFSDLRELEKFTVESGDYKIIIDFSRQLKLYNAVGLVAYICILVLFTVFTFFLSDSIVKEVIHPLEGIFYKVLKLSQNPMNVTRRDFDHHIFSGPRRRKNGAITKINDSITKIAYLMAIGYGEAGNSIIMRTLKSNTGINTDIPGEKIVAIFGFCDIRNFTDTTEVLQTHILRFVN